MDNLESSKLLRAKELEEAIGLPRSTIYRLAKAGKIPFYKTGEQLTGVRFITKEVLEALRSPQKTEEYSQEERPSQATTPSSLSQIKAPTNVSASAGA